MKTTKKIVIVSFFLCISISTFTRTPQKKINLLQDAVDNIQKTLNKEKPYRISREYIVEKDKVTMTQKIDYKEYRKKPSSKKEIFKIKSRIGEKPKTIKFVFNSNNKNQITKISTTNNRNKQIDKIQCSL